MWLKLALLKWHNSWPSSTYLVHKKKPGTCFATPCLVLFLMFTHCLLLTIDNQSLAHLLENLHPRKLTWQWNNQPFWRCMMYLLFKMGDFPASHVKFPGKFFHLEIRTPSYIPCHVHQRWLLPLHSWEQMPRAAWDISILQQRWGKHAAHNLGNCRRSCKVGPPKLTSHTDRGKNIAPLNFGEL